MPLFSRENFSGIKRMANKQWGLLLQNQIGRSRLIKLHLSPIQLSARMFLQTGALPPIQMDRVLSQDDDAIPGLYAVGETAGLYYGKYPGGTSVLRGLVFGRRAGEHAVTYVTNSQELEV